MKHNFTEKEEEKTRNVGSLIEGIVWVIIMATVLIGICCSCIRESAPMKNSLYKDKVSFYIYQDGKTNVLVHKETGCVYVRTSNNAAYVPLYNSDGTLYTVK